MSEAPQPIRMVSRRTGLSAHVIRVWERRYGAVKPIRTETNRRLYTHDDVERLALLRLATEAGHSIGNIARLPVAQLKDLDGVDWSDWLSRGGSEARSPILAALNKPRVESVARFVKEALAAVESLDPDGLERVLHRASVALGQAGLLQRLLAPLIEEIGNLWRSGKLRIAHEHTATAVIRSYLGNHIRSYALPATAPTLLVTTPSGQFHELGAVLAAAAAVGQGWRVVYLGPNLPTEEIVAAALQNRARAVALSIVYPSDDPHLPGEFFKLRELLPKDVAILVGGRASEGYAEALARIHAERLGDLEDFYAALDALRTRAR